MLSDSDEPSNDDVSGLNCKNRINGKPKNYNVFLKGSMNGIGCDFEIDTGASISLISPDLILQSDKATPYVTVNGIENVPVKAPCYVLPVTTNGVTDPFTFGCLSGVAQEVCSYG